MFSGFQFTVLDLFAYQGSRNRIPLVLIHNEVEFHSSGFLNLVETELTEVTFLFPALSYLFLYFVLIDHKSCTVLNSTVQIYSLFNYV